MIPGLSLFTGGGGFESSSEAKGEQGNAQGGQIDGLQAINNTLGGSFNIGSGSAKGGATVATAASKNPNPLGIVNPFGTSTPILIGLGVLSLLAVTVIIKR